MLNYDREPPIEHDSHDWYVPDEPIPDVSDVEEPEFITVERMSSMEYLMIHR